MKTFFTTASHCHYCIVATKEQEERENVAYEEERKCQKNELAPEAYKQSSLIHIEFGKLFSKHISRV